jgi:hypothetical protein
VIVPQRTFLTPHGVHLDPTEVVDGNRQKAEGPQSRAGRSHSARRLDGVARSPEGETSREDETGASDEIELLLIAAERERINELYRQGTLKDEARRRLEHELDLREANLAGHQHVE